MRTALRWLAVTVVFLLTAELFARVDDTVTWRAPLLGPYTEGLLMVRDPIVIRGRPEYRFEKWRMNNLGFRGADISEMPRPGIIRVVVLGASETFGLYESEGLEYPARMQSLLDSLAQGRFEVINAALPGMMLVSMVPYYESVVARLKPDYVFIYPTPSFYLFVSEPKPVVIGRPQPPVPTANRPVQPPDQGQFTSRLAAKGREAVKGLVPPALLNAYREWRLRRVRSSHPADWVWDAVPEGRMATFGQDLEQLLQVIQSGGSQTVMVTHTNRFVGCPSCLAGGDRRHAVNLMLRDYPRASPQVMVAVDSAANQVARDVARKVGAPIVDVEGRIPPTSKNFADYSHFTDQGADLMARILAAELLRIQQRRDSIQPGSPRP